MQVITVKELIEELQRLPQDIDIWSGDDDCEYYRSVKYSPEIRFVLKDSKYQSIFAYTKEDLEYLIKDDEADMNDYKQIVLI